MGNLQLLTQLEFGEGFWYNALPVGKFHDPRYGVVNITPKLVQDMASNFGKVLSYEPPVKMGHGDAAPSPGTIKQVQAREDGLWIQTDFTDPESVKDVKAKKFRYMSAEFVENYMDKSSGKSAGPVIVGVALTNQPAHPGVKPIVFSEGGYTQDPFTEPKQKEEPRMDYEKMFAELNTKFAALSEKVSEVEKEKQNIQTKLQATETQLSEAIKTIAQTQAEKKKAEVETFCEKYASTGVPPTVLEQIKPLLLSENATVKLSETEEKPLQLVFAELFDGMQKVDMGFRGNPSVPHDKTVLMADDIAAFGNGGNIQEG